MSDVVRDIMEYHQTNNLQEGHLNAIKRQSNNWKNVKEFLRQDRPNGAIFGIKHFEDVFWSAYWEWIKEREEKTEHW